MGWPQNLCTYMSWLNAATLLFAVTAAIAQTSTEPAPRGSVSGAVTDLSTGAPLFGLTVTLSVARSTAGADSGNSSGSATLPAKTDSQGRYNFPDLEPGSYLVFVSRQREIPGLKSISLAIGREILGLKGISLAAGRDLKANFSVEVSGSIAGIVTGPDKQPAAGQSVLLIQKMYQSGRTVLAQVGGAGTNAEGRYLLTAVKPGRVYLILAKPNRISTALSALAEEADKRKTIPTPKDLLNATQFAALSAVAEDQDKRKPIPTPTYYPNAPDFESGQAVVLRSGQNLDGMNIQMAQSQSYCAEGVMTIEGVPAQVFFGLHEVQPSNGGLTGSSSGFTMNSPSSVTGNDGRFRICDLHPGDYVFRAAGAGTQSLPTAVPLVITDRDLTGLRVNALSGMRLSGEVAWDGEQPGRAPDAQIRIDLLGTGQSYQRWPSGTSSLPGRFTVEDVYPEEYLVRASGTPDGFYVKDITYGGIGVLHGSLTPGAALGNATLKVVVARDGGTISARVADKDGNPVESASLCFLPAEAGTPAELETVFACSSTDAAGIGASGTLRPGKYRVVATSALMDHSVASIDALWGARLKGYEVELPPKGSVQVSVQPAPLY